METNDKKGVRRRDVIKGAIGAGGIAAGLSTASNIPVSYTHLRAHET